MNSAALPVLYSFRRCPYAIRARLALKVAGVAVEVREVVLRDKPAQMLAISPKGTVPVLQCDDGQVVAESLAIMHWALAQGDPLGWLVRRGHSDGPADGLFDATRASHRKADLINFIEINDGPFKSRLDQYKYPERHPQQRPQAARDEAVALLLAPMEQQLQASPCLSGEAPGLVDMALMPFVRQFARVDEAWFAAAPLPALQRWLARLLASPLFAAVMNKLPPWVPGQPVVML